MQDRPCDLQHVCRYIGVNKVVLYTTTAEGEHMSLIDHLSDSNLHGFVWDQIGSGFLHVRSITADDGATSQQMVHRQCIQDYKDEFSYIGFLDLQNYLLLPGAEGSQPGELSKLLAQDRYRYSPGASSVCAGQG